jgi:hypothetical protein
MPIPLADLKAILEAEKADALSAMNASKLSEDRSKAMEYYLGTMTDMPAPKDRSQAVSTDVADTVEGLMPNLMEIFCSGDDVVEFQPVGAEDEEGARQETDYVNHVFMQKNPGFLTLYTFIKDALLQKNGIVKTWWDEWEEEEEETYQNLSDDAYALLLKEVEEDDSLEIIEHTEKDAEEYEEEAAPEMMPPPMPMMGGAPMGGGY